MTELVTSYPQSTSEANPWSSEARGVAEQAQLLERYDADTDEDQREAHVGELLGAVIPKAPEDYDPADKELADVLVSGDFSRLRDIQVFDPSEAIVMPVPRSDGSIDAGWLQVGSGLRKAPNGRVIDAGVYVKKIDGKTHVKTISQEKVRHAYYETTQNRVESLEAAVRSQKVGHGMVETAQIAQEVDDSFSHAMPLEQVRQIQAEAAQTRRGQTEPMITEVPKFEQPVMQVDQAAEMGSASDRMLEGMSDTDKDLMNRFADSAADKRTAQKRAATAQNVGERESEAALAASEGSYMGSLMTQMSPEAKAKAYAYAQAKHGDANVSR